MSERLRFHVWPEGESPFDAIAFQALRADWEAIVGAIGEKAELPRVFTGWPSGPEAALKQPNMVWPEWSEHWAPPAKLVELGVMLPTWERWMGRGPAALESRKAILGERDLQDWYQRKTTAMARAVIQVPISMAFMWAAGYEPVVVMPKKGPYRGPVRSVVSWAWERCDGAGLELPV